MKSQIICQLYYNPNNNTTTNNKCLHEKYSILYHRDNTYVSFVDKTTDAFIITSKDETLKAMICFGGI